MQAWQAYQRHGILPQRGGWLDQPLAFIVEMCAVGIVYDTVRYKIDKGKDFNFKDLDATQRAILTTFEI